MNAYTAPACRKYELARLVEGKEYLTINHALEFAAYAELTWISQDTRMAWHWAFMAGIYAEQLRLAGVEVEPTLYWIENHGHTEANDNEQSTVD